MYIGYSTIAMLFMLSSCTLSDFSSQPIDTNIGMTDTGNTDHQSPLVETLTGFHEEYYPIFDGAETKTIHAVHKAGTPTRVSFINSSAKSAEVILSFPVASGANLRWSQVVMPDGTMDGPFGQKTGYNLKQSGGYTFIFSENMMASEAWSGAVDISISLRNTTYDTDVILIRRGGVLFYRFIPIL